MTALSEIPDSGDKIFLVRRMLRSSIPPPHYLRCPWLDALSHCRQTRRMDVHLVVEHRFRSAARPVFALSLDAARFPATFAGCGPIPAIRRITLHAPPAVGSTRELENSDGSCLSERITAHEPPRRHAYTLSGIRPPLVWLARCGHADWSFADDGAQACFVVWRYRFELSHALAWPLAFPLLRIFMRGAMQRCLVAMDAMLQAEQESAR